MIAHWRCYSKSRITSQLYFDNGFLNGVVFIDLKKAFDAIDHEIIVRKLATELRLIQMVFDYVLPISGIDLKNLVPTECYRV